jgi:hypothetical protein
VSLTLQPAIQPQAESQSPRRALRPVPPLVPLEAEPAVAAVTVPVAVPVAVTVAAGWYADPMGTAHLRWWDGAAWTANLIEMAPVEPDPAVAAASAVSAVSQTEPAFTATEAVADSSANVVEDAGLPAVLPVYEPAGAVEVASIASPAAASPSTGPVPALSRRQLRERVGRLTSAPVATEIAQDPIRAAVPDSAELVAPPVVPAPVLSIDSGPSESDDRSISASVARAAGFLDPAEVLDSSIPRAWIGAARPVVVATSASVAAVSFVAPAELAPVLPRTEPSAPAPLGARADDPATAVGGNSPISGSLGFILPPDPFAHLAAGAAPQAPPVFVAAAIAVPSAVAPLASGTRSTTWPVWVLALLPVLQAAYAWLLLRPMHLAAGLPLGIGLLTAPMILALVLAGIDRRTLRRRGFDRVAPIALAIVPPFYLILRAVRVGVAGIGPLLVWLLGQGAVISLILLHLPATVALLPAGLLPVTTPVVASAPISAAERASELTPTGMAAALTTQTLAKNLHFGPISCPALPSTVDGTAVTCVGTLASVRLNLNVVVDSSLPNSAFALVSEAPAA